jgi:hypothetical protein
MSMIDADSRYDEENNAQMKIVLMQFTNSEGITEAEAFLSVESMIDFATHEIYDDHELEDGGDDVSLQEFKDSIKEQGTNEVLTISVPNAEHRFTVFTKYTVQ